MTLKSWKPLIILFLVLGLGLAIPIPGFAESTCNEDIVGSILPSCVCEGRGPCQLRDFVSMVIEFSNWMLAIISGLTVLAMINAGWLLATAGGRSQQRETAITNIKNILIGAGFMLSAWVLVNATILGLKGSFLTETEATLFGEKWYEVRGSSDTCRAQSTGDKSYDCFDEQIYSDWHDGNVNDLCFEETSLCIGRGRRCCLIDDKVK